MSYNPKVKFVRYVWIRNEIYCDHGKGARIGHGPHIHGCDGCCSLAEFKEVFNRERKKSLKAFWGKEFDEKRYLEGCCL